MIMERCHPSHKYLNHAVHHCSYERYNLCDYSCSYYIERVDNMESKRMLSKDLGSDSRHPHHLRAPSKNHNNSILINR